MPARAKAKTLLVTDTKSKLHFTIFKASIGFSEPWESYSTPPWFRRSQRWAEENKEAVKEQRSQPPRTNEETRVDVLTLCLGSKETR